jgi:gamma-glutamyltranspeptidase / glutathione hydrolase
MTPRSRRTAGVVAACVAAALTVSACTDGSTEGSPAPGAEPGPTTSAPTTNAPRTGAPTVTRAPDTGDPAPSTQSPSPDAGLVPVGAYAVSAGHPAAVAAGMEMLAAGGTAVDAAVAAAFAVSVAEPFASGLGGGGAALVHELGEEPVAYDYREVVAQDGRIPASGVGVPGFVAGMERLHSDHGELAWADVVAPAVRLAEEGVPTTALLAGQLAAGAGRIEQGARDVFFPDGQALQEGELLVQAELGETLRAVAAEGAPVVYQDALEGSLTAVDGIDAASLAAYTVATPDPVTGEVGPFTVVGAAAPLTGVTLVQMLQMAASLGATESAPGSADFVDAVTVSWLRARQDLLTEVGDPAFVDVPLEELTDAERNADKVDGTVPPWPSTSGAPEGEGNTTHLTVVDAEGTVVSMTNTLTNFWGSGQEVGGFFLNDQLRRFELGQGSANAPEAGKRSLSYSSPTIVADDEGRPVLGLGSPGGARIPGVLTQVVLAWAFHGDSLQEAVDRPRFHQADGVLVTEPLPQGAAETLTARGYTVSQDPPFSLYFGSVQALEVDYDAGEVRGAEDDRRAGTFEVDTP